ncbi:MAG: hypothetical protein JRJ51_20615 [Deltaproteobacteria bacterium]|nr:hypothetical protein [Deltaproteobacteria bacterium]MBW1945215.1 hypothetical protein [Deltaproteobacteria bacterium]
MIKNMDILQTFENDFICGKGGLSFDQALALFTGMWREGCLLGVLPPKDPMEGIEIDIKIAKVLHSCSKNSCPD